MEIPGKFWDFYISLDYLIRIFWLNSYDFLINYSFIRLDILIKFAGLLNGLLIAFVREKLNKFIYENRIYNANFYL